MAHPPALSVLSIALQAALIVAAPFGVYWQLSSYSSSPENTFVIRLVAYVGSPSTGAAGNDSAGSPPTVVTVEGAAARAPSWPPRRTAT